MALSLGPLVDESLVSQATLVDVHSRCRLIVQIRLIIGEVLCVHRSFLYDTVKEFVFGPVREPAVVSAVWIPTLLGVDLQMLQHLHFLHLLQ